MTLMCSICGYPVYTHTDEEVKYCLRKLKKEIKSEMSSGMQYNEFYKVVSKQPKKHQI